MSAQIGRYEEIKEDNYIFEPKLDGYRAIAIYKDGKLVLFSRNGLNITDTYKEIKPSFNAKECIVDGEIVAYDQKGNPNFNLLQRHKTKVSYIIFDILFKDGKNLENYPLIERKKILDFTVVDKDNVNKIVYTDDGKKLISLARKINLEGIMAKYKKSKYEHKRSSKWIKIKFTKSVDCIVIGYLTKKRTISSLLLGIYNKNRIKYIGKVGTGFNKNTLDELEQDFSKHRTNNFNDIYEGFILRKNMTILKPIFVCEVKYLEFTNDERLRAPVFIRLRDDKKPKECDIEQLIKIK